MNTTPAPAPRDRRLARWSLGFLVGSTTMAIGAVASGKIAESLLRGPLHAIAMLILGGAFCGSFVFLGAIETQRVTDPRPAWLASLAASIAVAACFPFAIGSVFGIACSLIDLIAIALIITALRRSAAHL